MTDHPGLGPRQRVDLARDPHGLAALLLAILLAGGMALPLLTRNPRDPLSSPMPAPSDPGSRPGAHAAPRSPQEPDDRSALSSTSPLAFPASPRPRLDLNAADAQALRTLPGVGASLARRILSYRETHGPFRSAEDLRRVPGVGPSRWERIRPRVRVTEHP